MMVHSGLSANCCLRSEISNRLHRAMCDRGQLIAAITVPMRISLCQVKLHAYRGDGWRFRRQDAGQVAIRKCCSWQTSGIARDLRRSARIGPSYGAQEQKSLTSMRWSIRNQILIPFAVLQGIAVGVISISAAWSAAARAEREAVARLDQVVVTLSSSSFPVRGAVLEQMKGLSGADFIAASATDSVTATTLPDAVARAVIAVPRTAAPGTGRLGEFQPVTAGQESWLVGGVQVHRSPELRELLVLVPEQQWQTNRRDVILPPLLIGGLTMLAMAVLSYVIAAQLGSRMSRMQQQVGKLAALEFGQMLPVTGDDELTRLATSINRMAQDLQQATRQIRLSERTTLVTQVAGGLAHQLRNSITGARMAVQLHLRRCHDADRESLQVAIRQLSLTENQIRGLLSLTRESQQSPVAGRIDHILSEIQSLLEPQVRHTDASLTMALPSETERNLLVVADAGQTQAALLNLVQNALEACGPGGKVRVEVSLPDGVIQVDVLDSGSGVADDLRDRVFEPFVTGKPEGVGLGLTLAAQAAESGGGRLSYDRVDEWTRFRFQICPAPT